MSYAVKQVWSHILLMFALSCLTACGEKNHGTDERGMNKAQPVVPFTGADWAIAPRDSARIFISGHSLVDQPLPNYLAQIAQSMDTQVEWERQYVVGSAIVRRTRGEDHDSMGWVGYREGYNRNGEGLDVINEFVRPQSVQGGPYDVLLITEEHSMLDSLVSNDTVRYLRHFHDRFVEGNPQGVTYFYESWFSLEDKGDPLRWIEYERAASPIWQCVATRINLSLAAEGRDDRIVSLPAGMALAELISVATREPGLSGITQASVRETVDGIVGDTVHLTPLGSYYVALVTYASVYRRSPVGAWAPALMSAAQAKTLQQVAWEFVSSYYANYDPMTMTECRTRLKDSVISGYLTYMRQAYWKNELTLPHAYVRSMRRWIAWHRTFSRDDQVNPFHFDSATDKGYWFPAP